MPQCEKNNNNNNTEGLNLASKQETIQEKMEGKNKREHAEIIKAKWS